MFIIGLKIFVMRRSSSLRGGVCQSYGDHRVVMSLAIAGLVAKEPIVIEDVDCVETSFPGFQVKLLDLLTNSK